jgi:oligoendopeptidase F
MSSLAPAASTVLPPREAVDLKYTWDLSSIFADWTEWEAGFRDLDQGINAFAQFEGMLAQGPDRLLASLQERDRIGQLSYRVWYYPNLQYD